MNEETGEIMENENEAQSAEPIAEPQSVENEKVFTQAEVDALIKKRLDKNKREFERKFDGVDPDQYRSWKQEREDAEIERQKERGEFENVLKQMSEKKDTRINALQEELRRVKVDGALLSAASRGKAINAEQVANLLRSNVRMTDDGQVEVVDNSGVTRYGEDGSAMTPDSLVNEFLSGNPHFVAATPSGAGSRSSIGGTMPKTDLMEMSHEEYAEWRKQNLNRNKGYIKMR